MSLRTVPLSLAEANEWVSIFHRHHKPTQGYKFAIGCEKDGLLVGVVIAGRPVARGLDHHRVLEVTRLVTTGDPEFDKNVCSFLYSAAARAAKALGYERIQTYLLESEIGTSVKAAGWSFNGKTAGGDWNHSKKYAGTRRTDQPMCPKQRWIKEL